MLILAHAAGPMSFPLIPAIVTLVVAGLILWAVTQFPLDATIVKLIRVVVIVVAVLYLLNLLFGATMWPR
mgnify:CR=1 FL=1